MTLQTGKETVAAQNISQTHLLRQCFYKYANGNKHYNALTSLVYSYFTAYTL